MDWTQNAVYYNQWYTFYATIGATAGQYSEIVFYRPDSYNLWSYLTHLIVVLSAASQLVIKAIDGLTYGSGGTQLQSIGDPNVKAQAYITTKSPAAQDGTVTYWEDPRSQATFDLCELGTVASLGAGQNLIISTTALDIGITVAGRIAEW